MKKNDASGVVRHAYVAQRPHFHIYHRSHSSPTGIPISSFTGACAPLAWGDNTVWLLAVEPTIAAQGFVPEHGNWTIRVDGVGVHAEVHAYVARSDPNMDVRSGARRSYFVDLEWERTRSAAAGCKRDDGEFDKAGSLIHRNGTLNGIATARFLPCTLPAATSFRTDASHLIHRPALRAEVPAAGPDFVLPCDESYALRGIRAGGNRSGAVFRLTGTSVAAPQLARQVAKLAGGLPFPSPTDVPTTSTETEKRGGGNSNRRKGRARFCNCQSTLAGVLRTAAPVIAPSRLAASSFRHWARGRHPQGAAPNDAQSGRQRLRVEARGCGTDAHPAQPRRHRAISSAPPSCRPNPRSDFRSGACSARSSAMTRHQSA